jgi:hypothetical protein
MRAVNNRYQTKLSAQSDDDISFKPLSWWRERWDDRDIQRLFIENFIHIRDEDDDQKLKRLILIDVQIHLHYNRTGKDITLKARRQGSSTYWMAFFFCNAIVKSGREVRSTPHDPDTEEKFRAVYKTMYENLPLHLQPHTKYYSDDLIEIKDPVKGTINSRITTFCPVAGREGKGRGQTFTDWHGTEVPFWKVDVKKQMTAILEASQKGNISIESTAHGIEYFHGVYQQGKKKKNGWTSFFFEWWWKRSYKVEGAKFVEGRVAVPELSKNTIAPDGKEWLLLLPTQEISDVWQMPDKDLSQVDRADKRNRYDEAQVTDVEWAIAEKILAHLKAFGYARKTAKVTDREVAEYIAWRRKKIGELDGGEAEFVVEYPENDEDCFENTGNPVIRPKDCKVTCEPAGPKDFREYLIGCDTSRGYSHGDPQAIEIIDIQTGAQVFSEELKRKPDQLAYRLAELSDLYNFATIAVERNNTGVAVLQELQKLVEPERIYKHLSARLQTAIDGGKKTFDEAMEECDFGIETTAAIKPLMGMKLEQAIRTGEISLSSKDWVEQAKTVVWNDKGSWAAMPGYKDDRFIALAIANFVRVTSLGQFMGFIDVLPETGSLR